MTPLQILSVNYVKLSSLHFVSIVNLGNLMYNVVLVILQSRIELSFSKVVFAIIKKIIFMMIRHIHQDANFAKIHHYHLTVLNAYQEGIIYNV